MVVKVNENVLTVVSDIPVATALKGLTDLTAYDEKKNPVYKVQISLEGKGNLSQFGMVANSVVDGKAAVVIIEPIGTNMDVIKLKYGKAVVAAQKYIPIIANAAVTEEEMIAAAFGETTEATAE